MSKSNVKAFKVYCLPLTERKRNELKTIVEDYARIYNFAARFMPSLPEKYFEHSHPSELYTKWIKSGIVNRKIVSIDAFYAIQDAWANFKASETLTQIEMPNIAKFDNKRYEIIKKNDHYNIYLKPYKEFKGVLFPLITGKWTELIDHLDYTIEQKRNPGAITYNLRDNSISIPVKIPQGKKFVKKQKIETIIGIDLGINNHVVVSAIKRDKKVIGVRLFDGRMDKHRLKRQYKLRSKRQRKGKVFTGNKIANIKDTITDIISKQIVDFVLKYPNPIVVFEDLGNMGKKKLRNKQGGKAEKAQRRMISRWSYGAIRTKTEYKLKSKGIYTIEIKPYGTSQRCHRCGAIGIRDGIHFKCEKCGLGCGSNPQSTVGQYNADVNASINIALEGHGALYGRQDGIVEEPNKNNVQPEDCVANPIPTEMTRA